MPELTPKEVAELASKIKLNQPIWVLIVFLVALGFSEFYQFRVLYWISLLGSIWMGILVVLSITAYSWRSRHNK